MGEATHGSHEFFTMRQRLLEFMVEKMGFTIFAMEGSWSAGEQINTYILTGQGSARGLCRAIELLAVAHAGSARLGAMGAQLRRR